MIQVLKRWPQDFATSVAGRHLHRCAPADLAANRFGRAIPAGFGGRRLAMEVRETRWKPIPRLPNRTKTAMFNGAGRSTMSTSPSTNPQT